MLNRLTPAVLALGFLTGCQGSGLDRLIEGRETAKVQSAGPTTGRVETYQFTGVVTDSPYSHYYGVLKPGDPVSGTFRINFDAELVHENPTSAYYRWGFVEFSGRVGPYEFASSRAVLTVVNSPSYDAIIIDTGGIDLDGRGCNYDVFFTVREQDVFSNTSLENARDLHLLPFQRRAALWFEWNPGMGEGFNCDITELRKIDDVIL